MSRKKTLITSKTKNIRAIGAFIILLIGLVATVIAVQQSQDIRDRAAETTQAEVSFTTSSTPLPVGTSGFITMQLNTKGQPIDGVQLVFDLYGRGKNPPDITLEPIVPQGMKVVWNQKESIPQAYRVSFALVNQTITQPFSNTAAQDILKISMVSPKSDTLEIVVDPAQSAVIKYKEALNILTPVVDTTFIVGTGGPTIAPTSCPSIVPRPGNTGNFVGGIFEFIKTMVGNIAYLFAINTAQFPPELPYQCGQITGESCRPIDQCTQGCPVGFSQTVGRCGGSEKCCKPL